MTMGCNSRPKNINDDGGLIIKVKIDAALDSEISTDSILSILSNRLNSRYPDNNPNVIYNSVSKTFIAEIPDVNIDEAKWGELLVSSQGEFEISEVVTPSDFRYDTKIDSLFKNNDTLKLLQSPDTRIIGAAYVSDTSKINAYFRAEENKSLFSSNYNYTLYWGLPLDEYYNEFAGLLPLYCLKKSPNNIDLNKACEEIKIDKSSHNGEDFISITMKREYFNKWEHLTGSNIGRTLAIRLDKRIISAPTVQNAITGGQTAIFGKFNKEEYSIFESLLKEKTINVPLKIVSVKEIAKNNSK